MSHRNPPTSPSSPEGLNNDESLAPFIQSTKQRLISIAILVYLELISNILLCFTWLSTGNSTFTFLLLSLIGLTCFLQFLVGINTESGDKFSCRWGFLACCQCHLLRMPCVVTPYHPLLDEKFNNFHMAYFLSSFWQFVLKTYVILIFLLNQAGIIQKNDIKTPIVLFSNNPYIIMVSSIISLTLIITILINYACVSQRVSCIVDGIKSIHKQEEHKQQVSAANILNRLLDKKYTKFVIVKWNPLPYKSYNIPLIIFITCCSISRSFSFIFLLIWMDYLNIFSASKTLAIIIFVLMFSMTCCGIGKALSTPPYIPPDQKSAYEKDDNSRNSRSRSSMNTRNRTASVLHKEEKDPNRTPPFCCMSIVGWLDVVYPFWTMKTLFITGWHVVYNPVGLGLRRMSIFREVSSIVIGICFGVWSLNGINVVFVLSLVVVLCACVSLGIELRLNGLSVEQMLYENYERGKERERAMSDSGTVDALKIEVSANQNKQGMVFVPSETVTPVTPGSPASGVDEMETVDETGEEMFATVLTVGNEDEEKK